LSHQISRGSHDDGNGCGHLLGGPRGAARARPDYVRGEPDEFGDFETISYTRFGGPFLPDPNATTMLPNDYVRNVLKEGLKYQPALEAELPQTHLQQEASLAALVHLTAYTTLSQ
jgi:hypothetical protein